jgi:prepilin-type N-terminal cleavage/methylation domain-containing protein
MNNTTQKGFTLIELLVVIAIVAVLSVVVILTLNPAELLRQARDSTRIADMGTYKSAISLYLTDVSSPSIASSAIPRCYVHASSSITICSRFAAAASGTIATTTSVFVNGSGWVPIDFTAISSGAPLSVLPIDPVNNSTYYYAYKGSTSTLTYEMNAVLESTKFQPYMSNSYDGGSDANAYEVGTDPGLDL